MADFVSYEQFGAVGDGKTDDMEAIARAHDYANEHDLPVKANADAVYYIGTTPFTAQVRTDTDWNTARFIIDDRSCTEKDRVRSVFHITGGNTLDYSVTSLKKGQKKLPAPPAKCYVSVSDKNKLNYIRYGANQNNGAPQTDNFALNENGDILHDIVWDFDEVTDYRAVEIPSRRLTVTGGDFKTIANNWETQIKYFERNIRVDRSNTTLSGITHRIEGEGETGAPYSGFITLGSCAYVTVSDCFLTGHKYYHTIGSANVTVPVGTYDITAGKCADISFVNCRQNDADIMDRTKWGVFGSNYCKNLRLDRCVFSRFDAHMGVTNAEITGCKLGWMCLNAIGHGTLIVADTDAYGSALVNLREDYGSTWDGDIIIKNCTWHPAHDHPSVIAGQNNGTHDFGYTCFMPRSVIIDGLYVTDDCFDKKYGGISIFNNFDNKPDCAVKPYPYIRTKKLSVNAITCDSGKPWIICRGEGLMPELKVTALQ